MLENQELKKLLVTYLADSVHEHKRWPQVPSFSGSKLHSSLSYCKVRSINHDEKIQNIHLMYRGFIRPGYQPTASKLKGKSDNNLRE
jgi:hypothetical protein